jgi:CHAT domain-containing protein/tetratricopeptide (TPR) repeat protein
MLSIDNSRDGRGCAMLSRPSLVCRTPENLRGPRKHATRRVLALLIVLGSWGGLCGQTQPEAQDLARAERLYERSELAAAEPLYLAALPQARGTERRLCFDRLLSIYYRLGRHDRAIRLGDEYRAWLATAGDEPRRREVLHQVGVCYLALGHFGEAGGRFREVLEDRPGLPAPSPRVRVEALAYLAQIAEKFDRRDEARKRWLEVEAYARKVLDDPPEPLAWEDRTACTAKLSDGYRFLKRPAEAIDRLKPLLDDNERRKDVAGQCEALRMLAGHRAADNDLAGAERDLRRALALAATLDRPDRVRLGDLRQDLAGVLAGLDRAAGARREREEAAALYGAVVRAGPDREADHQPPEVAFWKLQALYQQARQFDAALRLADEQLGHWGGESLAGSRLQAEQGILRIYSNLYGEARDPLRNAVEALRRQSPRNLSDLPRTLNSLAVVEQAGGDLDKAAALAGEALGLYADNDLPADLVKAESLGILGTCEALRGRYHAAFAHFDAGVECCARLGKPADRQRCNLLLNIALLHKAQGDLGRALAFCREALAVFEGYGDRKTIDYACFLCALTSLDAARGEFAEAGRHASELEKLCDHLEVKGGLLRLAALHGQALDCLSRRDYDRARQFWLTARDALEKDDDPLLPRTLNYLGLTAELEHDPAAAKRWYEQALRRRAPGGRSYPATRFVSLWRLAGLLDHDKDRDGARRLLEEAVGLVEAGRLETYGDPQQRATYFAEFAPAFERLVDSYVDDRRPADALAWSARGRSRTLLDQLQAAGVDPRDGLTAPDQRKLRDHEARLRQEISRIRLEAQALTPSPANAAQLKTLTERMEKAQREYAEVWGQVLDASEVYRHLAPGGEQDAALLTTLRRDVLRRGTALLAYHVGDERSYVMLLGDSSTPPEVIPLTVPARLLDAEGPDRPLTRESAARLVERYRRVILSPKQRTRGVEVEPAEPSDPAQDLLVSIADVLLPAPVRQRLKELKPARLIVVPDGALHTVPLESLLLRAGPSPRYGLDELPPTVYAPSLSVLVHLARRPPLPAAARTSLLTVCNPAYPQPDAPAAAAGGSRSALLTAGQLKPLPGSARESASIRKYFDDVTPLDGPAATEKALRDNLPGQRVVHLAVHGLVDPQSHNLFGALALTPPADARDADPDNDGLLHLHEIYGLSLKDCDLAVLSACQTNVGPLPPLEAGVTLANGFLTAGARNVLASHWPAHDEATAELIAAFFAKAMPAKAGGEGQPYAVALRDARKEIRARRGWSSPVYWAPFVLIGPGETEGQEWPDVGESADDGGCPVAEVAARQATSDGSGGGFGRVGAVLGVGLAALGALAVVIVRSRGRGNAVPKAPPASRL